MWKEDAMTMIRQRRLRRIRQLLYVLTSTSILLSASVLWSLSHRLSLGGWAYVWGWSWIVIGLGTWAAFLYYRDLRNRFHREDKIHCRSCAYDLTGNVSGVCPECGTKIEMGSKSLSS